MSLTVIEAARISAIVEEALEKLSFLASITPDVMAHRDELSQIVGRRDHADHPGAARARRRGTSS